MQMPTDVEISSHRPLLGPFIVLYKKLIKLIGKGQGGANVLAQLYSK